MIRITILVHEFVTGGGLAGQDLPRSWAAEGRAMRRALAEDFAAVEGVSVVMTLDDRLPDEPGPWTIVRIGAGEEPATFSQLVAASDYTLCVAPETGGILEERARMIEEAGGRSLGCSPSAVALCGDKLRCGEHLRAVGIPTPRSVRVVPREGLPRNHPYPAVLKPIDGAGSLDTYTIESPDDLPESARAMTEALLQPFEPGSPMSAAFLVPETGEPRLIGVAEQHVERRGGRFAYLGGRVPADLPIPAPVVEAVRSVPGLRGWVGVDFMRCDATGRVVVLEINPRATTSFVGWREVAPEAGLLARAWLEGADRLIRVPLVMLDPCGLRSEAHGSSTTSGTRGLGTYLHSPVGAASCSPGREPWVPDDGEEPEPRRGDTLVHRCRPYGAALPSRPSTQGSRPGLHDSAPTGLDRYQDPSHPCLRVQKVIPSSFLNQTSGPKVRFSADGLIHREEAPS